MVRKKAIQKRKSNLPATPASPKRPSRSDRASRSMIESPKRQSPTAKQLHTSKVKTIEKKKKRKKASAHMRVGTKIFTISGKILREIKHYQTSVNTLIPKLSFARLVQEIICIYIPQGRRIQRTAIEALQEAAEYYLVQYLEDSYVCSLHARRSTLLPRDMELVERLRSGS